MLLQCIVDKLSKFTLEKSLFTNNNATSLYGAIFLSITSEKPSSVSVKDSKFINNCGMDNRMNMTSDQARVSFSNVVFNGDQSTWSSWVSTFIEVGKDCYFNLSELDINGYISNRIKSVFTITSSSDCKVQYLTVLLKIIPVMVWEMFSVLNLIIMLVLRIPLISIIAHLVETWLRVKRVV